MDQDSPRFADHREHARAIIAAGQRAADPVAALLRHVPDELADERIVLVGAGKAALEMGLAFRHKFGRSIVGGALAVVPERAAGRMDMGLPFSLHAADHPLPTVRNLVAAKAIAEAVKLAGPLDTVVMLLSGGGSSHLTYPAPGLELEHLREISGRLMRAGATIREINTVRKHCERLKGGRLARLAAPAPVRSYILSDVMGDRLDVIASGPTAPDPTTFADALAVLDRRGLRGAVPPVTKHLEEGASGRHEETPKPGDPTFDRVLNIVIGSNVQALAAARKAAEGMGFVVAGCAAQVEGEASEIGRRLASEARRADLSDGRARCWLIGGEATVTVGDSPGRGGPCQEMALAGAMALDGIGAAAMVAFATDGIDGPTDAAGAIVTGRTCGRARKAGEDPQRYLEAHDSAEFLRKYAVPIRTGPTGTNVNQLAFLLAYPK